MIATRWLAVLWAVAWLLWASVLAVQTDACADTYAELGLELPFATVVLLNAGEAFRAVWGLLPLALLLALGLAPLRLVPAAPALRRWFLLGLAHVGLCSVFAWRVLHLPLDTMHLNLDGPHLPPAALAIAGAALLVSTGLQAWTWTRLCLAMLRAPRDDGQTEASRLLVVAAVPAALASLAACSAVAALRPRAPRGLLVTPDVAAAGTAALVVVGLVVWLRLRLRAPETAPRRPEDPARV